MRDVRELLTILRNNANVINNEILFGLCHEIYVLFEKHIFSYEEKYILFEYIRENMPKMTDDDGLISDYGWPPEEWTPRLKWLNEHIELTKTN